MCTSLSLDEVSQIFSIATPIILFCWFLFARKNKFKQEYLKEIPGKYGGWYRNEMVTGKYTEQGGVTLEIFQIDSNGNFKGQFSQSGNSEDKRPTIPIKSEVHATVFCAGKLKHSWNLKPFRKRGFLEKGDNRIYYGELYAISRLDVAPKKKEEIIDKTYAVTHYRESGILAFKLKYQKNWDHHLPLLFDLFKSFDHMMDPYKAILEARKLEGRFKN